MLFRSFGRHEDSDKDRIRIFPATLDGWYALFPPHHFQTWKDLKEAFLSHFRPWGYHELICHELANIHMLLGESIHTYGTRTKILASKRREPTA